MVEVMRPPITARAIGARISPPSPSASAVGSIPKIIARVVMMIGRSRICPASISAVRRSPPAARALSLTGAFAPEPGYEIVPKPEAEALVEYLLSLKSIAPLPESQ